MKLWRVAVLVACGFAAVVLLLFAYSCFFEQHKIGSGWLIFGLADLIGALACIGAALNSIKRLKK